MRRYYTLLSITACVLSLSAPVALSARTAEPQQGHAYGKDKEKHKEKKAKDKESDAHHNDAERARLLALDVNHDGVVTRREFHGDDRVFAAHDWNHDGVLSGDELRPSATRPATVSPRPATAPPRPATATPQPATERDEVLFARRDTNHDGRISRNEFPGSDAEFARLDKNRDGVLSPYEYGVGR